MFSALDLFRRRSINIRAILRYPLSSKQRKAYRLQLQYRRLALRPIPPRFSINRHKPPVVNQSPIRIAAISHNLNLEGAPLAQMELLFELAQSGSITPTIISPRDGPLRSEYESANVAVKILAPLDFTSVETIGQALSSVQNAFVECRPDVVYANTLVSFWAIIAAERMKLPSIWNVREVEPARAYFDRLPGGVREQAYKCFRYPYRVIFVSSASFHMNAQFESERNFDVICDALDRSRMEKKSASVSRRFARAEFGLADSDIGIAIIGTVCEDKGQLDIIGAVSRMPEQAASKVVVFIVGDRGGDYSKRLLSAKDAMPPNLASRIHIVAASSRSHAYLSAADIAVCCSRGDSYPRVVQEAMFFDLPLVTTLACGCELVHENLNALVYSAGDERALASHLTRLVTDAELRKRFASNSRKILRSLPAFNEMVRQYGRIFEEARNSNEAPNHILQ